jgi:hypothetical protein
MSETERRAYVLADNKLALNAGWDHEMLAIELQGLIDLEFDVGATGLALLSTKKWITPCYPRRNSANWRKPIRSCSTGALRRIAARAISREARTLSLRGFV